VERKPLHILHVIPSLDPKDGGPSVAVPLIACAVAGRGHRVAILTTRLLDHETTRREGAKERRKEKGENGSPAAAGKLQSDLRDGVEYVYAKRNTEFYKVSFELVRWLKTNIRNFDLLHIHALFSFASTAASFIAAKNNVPYIIRPLGVLNQWGLQNRRASLKRASLALIEKRILTGAAAIHYTAEAEQREAAKIGDWAAKLPSFVVPLPAAAFSAAGSPSSVVSGQWSEKLFENYPQARGKRIVLFLSRIDRKKGIELLLEAFADVRKEIENLMLVIAGSGDRSYELSLREKAKQLKMSESTLWTGFVSGEEKAAVLNAAEIFVLPSYSENFGIAAAEAFAAGKACILSDQVGLAQEARRNNAAIVTSCNKDALAGAMKNILSDSTQQATLGLAARKFATDHLSPEAIGTQLDNVYRKIAAKHKVTETGA
jgi:glycosyltransferase involved in cell wall biosynthesis